MTSFVAALILDNAGLAIVAVVVARSSRLRRGRQLDPGKHCDSITWHHD
jgi:hypothetical protein